MKKLILLTSMILMLFSQNVCAEDPDSMRENSVTLRKMEDGNVELLDVPDVFETVIVPAESESGMVTRIGEKAFAQNTNLKEIEIPEGVTSIGDYSFFGCTNLNRVVLPDSLTNIGLRYHFICYY